MTAVTTMNRHTRLVIGAFLSLSIALVVAVFGYFDRMLARAIPGTTGVARVISVEFWNEGVLSVGPRSALPQLLDAGRAVGLETLIDPGWSTELPVGLAAVEAAQPLVVGFVFDGYFETLGVQSALGSLTLGRHADGIGAVISEHLWRSKFAAAPEVLGRSVTVNGHRVMVVGVARQFRGIGIFFSRVGTTDVWISADNAPLVQRISTPATVTALLGRIAPSASFDAVRTALESTTFSAQDATDPRLRAGTVVARAAPGFGRNMRTDPTAAVLFSWSGIGAGSLLLLVMINGGSLLLMQAQREQADFRLRIALGARAMDLVALVAKRAIPDAALSTFVGIGFAHFALVSLANLAIRDRFPPLNDLGVGPRELAVGALAGGLAAIAVMVAPVLWVLKFRKSGLFVDGYSTGGRGVITGAMVAQCAAATAMLAIGVSMGDALREISTTPTGFQGDNVLELRLRPIGELNSSRRLADVQRQLLDRLEGRGMGPVVVSAPSPLAIGVTRASFTVGSVRHVRNVRQFQVSPGFFDLMGAPLVRGRDFRRDEFDRPSSLTTMPIIVSASLATAVFGSVDCLGRELDLEWQSGAAGTRRAPAIIVGVAPTLRSADVLGDNGDTLYFTNDRGARPAFLLDARAGWTRAALAREVAAIDPLLPLDAVATLSEGIRTHAQPTLVLARLTMGLGLGAVLVIAMGLWASVLHRGGQQRRATAVRLALGATRLDVVRAVSTELVLAGIAGAGLGTLTHVLLMPHFAASVYGVDPLTPVQLVSVSAAVMALLAMSASVAALRSVPRAIPVVLREPGIQR